MRQEWRKNAKTRRKICRARRIRRGAGYSDSRGHHRGDRRRHSRQAGDCTLLAAPAFDRAALQDLPISCISAIAADGGQRADLMSWNNQGGGPWRSPGRGPPGQGPSGPPTGDLEEIIRRVQEALGKLTPGGLGGGKSAGGGLSGRTILFVVLAAVLVWFVWGTFYTIQPNEVGINLVLGRYTGKTAAGLNTNWPWPIGTVIKVPVWDQQITEVGYRSLGSNADIPEESQMLTGDKNIVDVHFRVNWQIDPAKPEDYAFNILSPRETVKAVAESIMREVVGLKTIDGILTTDRASVETDAQKRIQNVLNNYRAGVLVKQVQLQSVDAPSQVISAYRDVTAAQQDQQRAVNEAETYANKVVPEAEGGAARIIAEANAYREQTDDGRAVDIRTHVQSICNGDYPGGPLRNAGGLPCGAISSGTVMSRGLASLRICQTKMLSSNQNCNSPPNPALTIRSRSGSRRALSICIRRQFQTNEQTRIGSLSDSFRCAAAPEKAVSDQFFGPPPAVVGSGYEQPVPILQQLA